MRQFVFTLWIAGGLVLAGCQHVGSRQDAGSEVREVCADTPQHPIDTYEPPARQHSY